MIRTRVGEGAKVAFRLDDHQMNVERLGGRAANGLQHGWPDADIRHKAAIHHVDMDPIGTGGINGANFFAQPREVCR
jgi:hypothetical protein